jgi:hypothetical protein
MAGWRENNDSPTVCLQYGECFANMNDCQLFLKSCAPQSKRKPLHRYMSSVVFSVVMNVSEEPTVSIFYLEDGIKTLLSS